jgi:hypothetical protein
MPLYRIDLIAPNSLPITGIKLLDGSISKFEYSYDEKSQVSYYKLPNGHKQVESVLVDSEENEWNMADVEYYSLMHNK